MKRWLCASLALIFYASILPWAGADYFNYRAHDITGDGGNISGFDNITNTGYGGTSRTGDLITKGPWVDVRAFIPVALHAGIVAATNTEDLAPYINAAIDNAGQTPVVFRIGSYRTKTPIVLHQGTRLIGMGRIDPNNGTTGARISHVSATLDNVFTVGNPPVGYSYTSDIEVANLGVDGDNNTNAIFNLYAVANSSFHDLRLFDGAYGVYINYGMLNTFDRIDFRNQTTSSAYISPAAITTTQTFNNCHMAGAPWGLRVITDTAINGEHYGIVLNSCTIENMSVGAIEVYKSASIFINNLYTEAVPANSIADNAVAGTILRLFLSGSTYNEANSVAVISGGTLAGGNYAGYIGNTIETYKPYLLQISGVRAMRSNYFLYFAGVPSVSNAVSLYGNILDTQKFTNQHTYKGGSLIGQMPVGDTDMVQIQTFVTPTLSVKDSIKILSTRYGIIRGDNENLGRGGAIRISTTGITATETVEIGMGESGTGVFYPTMRINGNTIPTYDNNAAAVSGGLSATDVYRTSVGQLMIVY